MRLDWSFYKEDFKKVAGIMWFIIWSDDGDDSNDYDHGDTEVGWW